jgi:metal-responsive CopG/Arc/MetJ family transcriptional regulator
MNRTSIYLTNEQRERLDARARAEKVSRAELIRQVLDRALSGELDRLDADVAAIEVSFGALDDEGFVLERGEGARGAHLERISGR